MIALLQDIFRSPHILKIGYGWRGDLKGLRAAFASLPTPDPTLGAPNSPKNPGKQPANRCECFDLTRYFIEMEDMQKLYLTTQQTQAQKGGKNKNKKPKLNSLSSALQLSDPAQPPSNNQNSEGSESIKEEKTREIEGEKNVSISSIEAGKISKKTLKILKQIEFYFSDANLNKDVFLRAELTKVDITRVIRVIRAIGAIDY